MTDVSKEGPWYLRTSTFPPQDTRYLLIQEKAPRVQWVKDFRKATRFTDWEEVGFHQTRTMEAFYDNKTRDRNGWVDVEIGIIPALMIEKPEIEKEIQL